MSITLSSSSIIIAKPATRWNFAYCMKAAILWLAFCSAFAGGVFVRRWTWVRTEDIRFHFDISNGFRWGLRVNHNEQIDYTRSPNWGEFFAGYRNLYGRETENPSRTGPALDYSPFRLLIMGLWVKSVLAVDPLASGWINRDANPLMWFNTLCGFAAAVGVYFLLRLWLYRRAARYPLHQPKFIQTRAVIAALCMWFNPAILLDAHAWPQWDVWCVPFYVWALYAGSVGAWYGAGVLIALGAMLKGQILLVAPVLLIWALLSDGWKGWRNLSLAVLGAVTTGVIVGCMWLIPNARAWLWVGSFILIALLVGMIFSYALRRAWLYYVSGVLCVGIIGGSFIFGGSHDWLDCSFFNSTESNIQLTAGAINLPAILETRYGWGLDDIAFSLPTHWWHLNDGVTLKWTLRWIYIVMLVLCGVAAAVQTRRRSPRALVGLIAPWVIMYAILPQMRERYLLWGACITAIGVGIDLELTILFLPTMAIGFVSIYVRMDREQGAGDLLNNMIPDIGWITLIVALAYFYQAWKSDSAALKIVHRGDAESAEKNG